MRTGQEGVLENEGRKEESRKMLGHGEENEGKKKRKKSTEQENVVEKGGKTGKLKLQQYFQGTSTQTQ